MYPINFLILSSFLEFQKDGEFYNFCQENVESFADFIQSVLDKEHTLISTKIIENIVEISKE